MPRKLTPDQIRAINAKDHEPSGRRPVPASEANAHRHKGWTLYSRDVDLQNGNGKRRIYFFSKNRPQSGRPSELPAGFTVKETPNGLPVLARGA